MGFVLILFLCGLCHAMQYQSQVIDPKLAALYIEPSSTPKGVLFLFHGCNHNAEDWFLLPAEMTLVRTALRNQLVCVAIPSFDRTGSRCWHPDNDTQRVKRVFSNFVSGRWPHQNYYAAGASSGGSFVSYLGNFQHLPLSAIGVYVSAGMPPGHEIHKHHPPAIFVYMSEDQHLASRERLQAYTEKLEALGVDSKMLACDPKKVTAEFLNNYYRPWSITFCNSLVRQLEIASILETSGTLVEDPRNIEEDWVDVLLELLKPTLNLNDPKSIGMNLQVLRELLNIAWGVHEMTGEYAADVVDFFLTHQK